MTRDTKLALVVGFALVLAVGVLISDHFAAGGQSPPADLAEAQPAVLVRDIVGDDWDSQRRPRRQNQGATQGGPDRSPGREIAGGSAPQEDRQASPERGERIDPPTEFLLGNPEFHQLAQSGPARGLLPHERDQLGGPVSLLPLADTQSNNRSIGDQAQQPNPGSRARSTSQARWHIVTDGESLWEIAKHYYGKGSLWPKLAELNADRVAKSGVVRKGVRLRIPEPIAMGLPNRTLPEPSSPSGQRGEALTSTNLDESATRSYTVAKNQTLGEIASKELGSAKRMGEIVKLNGIKDPNEIRAGMVLRLPKL